MPSNENNNLSEAASNGVKIQCSVPILTLNSGKTLERLLQSLKNFDDVYIVDGNSTDDTKEIAAKQGIPIYKQVETDEPNVKIKHFAEMRQKSYSFVKHAWIFDIDSDEYITPELEGEIRKIVEEGNENKICYIQRFPLIEDKIIRHAFFIPDYYPRLFNLKSGIHYAPKKVVHEKLEIPEKSEIIYLKEAVVSGWPAYEDCIAKDNYYIDLMKEKRKSLSLKYGGWVGAINFLKALNIIYKSAVDRIKYPEHGLPSKYIWRFIRYHLILSKNAIKAIKLNKL